MSDKTHDNTDVDMESKAGSPKPATSTDGSASTRPYVGTPEEADKSTSDPSNLMSPRELAEQQSYIAQMEDEMKKWSEIAMQRKKALRFAERQLDSKPLVITYESIAETLSEDRRQFLAARPDYKGLLAFAQTTLVATKIANEESQLAALRVQSAMDKARGIIKDVTRKIINRRDPIIDGED